MFVFGLGLKAVKHIDQLGARTGGWLPGHRDVLHGLVVWGASAVLAPTCSQPCLSGLSSGLHGGFSRVWGSGFRGSGVRG